MKHVVSDKDMAEISDRIEEEIAEALTFVYNEIAMKFHEDVITSEQMFEAGEAGPGELFDMRDLAIKLFDGLGLKIEGNGKGF